MMRKNKSVNARVINGCVGYKKFVRRFFGISVVFICKKKTLTNDKNDDSDKLTRKKKTPCT